MESVESHCKATHQVLAQASDHFIILNIYYLNKFLLQRFSADSVSASQTMTYLSESPQEPKVNIRLNENKYN